MAERFREESSSSSGTFNASENTVGPHLIGTLCLARQVAARMHRISPEAKIIVLLRDPVAACFSGENMFRQLGISAGWSYLEQMAPHDARLVEAPEDTKLWRDLETLGPEDPLPPGLMERFYAAPTTPLRVNNYYERLQPLLRHYRRDQFMVRALALFRIIR